MPASCNTFQSLQTKKFYVAGYTPATQSCYMQIATHSSDVPFGQQNLSQNTLIYKQPTLSSKRRHCSCYDTYSAVHGVVCANAHVCVMFWRSSSLYSLMCQTLSGVLLAKLSFAVTKKNEWNKNKCNKKLPNAVVVNVSPSLHCFLGGGHRSIEKIM